MEAVTDQFKMYPSLARSSTSDVRCKRLRRLNPTGTQCRTFHKHAVGISATARQARQGEGWPSVQARAAPCASESTVARASPARYAKKLPHTCRARIPRQVERSSDQGSASAARGDKLHLTAARRLIQRIAPGLAPRSGAGSRQDQYNSCRPQQANSRPTVRALDTNPKHKRGHRR